MLPPLSVLVVEDDDDLRRLYRDVLRLAGFRVTEARSGYEALKLLESELPDVIVLDLVMPGLDGLTVRRELAHRPETQNIPIVIVTGSPGHIGETRPNCFLVKPVTSKQLLAAVSRCLGPDLMGS